MKNSYSPNNLLRLIGSFLILGSVSNFLLSGWSEWTTMERSFGFLATTWIFALSGLFCLNKMDDEKSARVLMFLSASTIPVHFANWGSILLKILQTPGGSLKFSNPVIFISSLCLLSLVPIGVLVFKVLDVKNFKDLNLIYFLSCILLYIPIREPFVMGLFLSFMIGLNIYHEKKNWNLLKISNPWVLRGLLIFPFCILAGRTLLYQGNILFYSYFFALVSVVLLYSGNKFKELKVLTSVAALGFNLALVCLNTYFGVPLQFQIYSYSLLLFFLSFFVEDKKDTFLNFSLCLGHINLLLGFFIGMKGILIVFSLLLPLLVTINFYKRQDMNGVKNAGFAFFICVLFQLFNFVRSGFIESWTALAAVGIFVVLSASLFEKHSPKKDLFSQK